MSLPSIVPHSVARGSSVRPARQPARLMARTARTACLTARQTARTARLTARPSALEIALGQSLGPRCAKSPPSGNLSGLRGCISQYIPPLGSVRIQYHLKQSHDSTLGVWNRHQPQQIPLLQDGQNVGTFCDVIPLLSVFINSYIFKIVFTVSVIPQPCCSIDQSKRSWTKKILWKCRLNTNPTHVLGATSPSSWPKISKCTCFSMMERSPTLATSAAIQASKLLIWEHTCWFIVERSLSIANSATTPVHQLVPSRNTC